MKKLLLAFVLSIILSEWLSLRTNAMRAEAALIATPYTTCGTVSCTLYLPILFNLTPPAAPPQFEVTQGIQQPDNSVRLIASRPTYVRWTLTSNTPYTNVVALLYGTRNGVALPGSPLRAVNNPRTLQASANRSVLNDTFNFKLPAAWATGDVVLYAKASNTTSYSMQTNEGVFHFTASASLPVKVVPIAYTCTSSGTGTTTPTGPFGYLTPYTFQVYPVPSIITTTHPAVSYGGPCNGSTLPKPGNSDWDAMLDAVTAVWQTEGQPNIYYYGLIKLDCGSSCVAGLGWIGLPVAAGFDGFGITHSGASETHAHEVGHNHGREHAPGCGVAGADPNFPYKSADGKALLGNSAKQNFGFNIDTQEIDPYTGAFYDYMSYCRPGWTSDYTYEALWQFANTMLRGINPASVSSEQSWLISGSIDPHTDRVRFDPAYAIDLPARSPEPGDYVLELLDQADRVVAAYPFAPLRAQPDRYDAQLVDEEIISFHLTVPYVENVATLHVRRGTTTLGTLARSASQPRLVAVTRSAQLAPDDSVRWASSNVTGNPLYYLVRASADQGRSWQTIGVNLTTPQITLHPEDFGGQDVWLEVLGSDGLNTTTLRLGPFFVAKK